MVILCDVCNGKLFKNGKNKSKKQQYICSVCKKTSIEDSKNQLDYNSVSEIKARRALGEKLKDIAIDFNVSISCISRASKRD